LLIAQSSNRSSLRLGAARAVIRQWVLAMYVRNAGEMPWRWGAKSRHDDPLARRMTSMTWGEFKKRLEQQGVEDGDKLDYIDWHDDGMTDGPVATYDERLPGSFHVN